MNIFLQADPVLANLPSGGGNAAWWVVGVLLTTIPVIWGLYINTTKKLSEHQQKLIESYDARIKDRDEQIKLLTEKLNRLEEKQYTWIAEIRPSLEANNSVFQTILGLLNGK